ncbi:hypothetical protein SDC9_197772 [bioreactor metagenome]|uniref:Uncharacterized protein n=1 Tax=bioreactor metagenome TaxID=1076179 RepID=A0A645IGP0_9ZZZZ
MRHHGVNDAKRQVVMKVRFIKHNADLRLDLFFVACKRQPQQGRFATVRLDQPQQCFDGGGFARPVFAYKPHNAATGHRKADVLQCKAGKLFIKVLYLNCVFHCVILLRRANQEVRAVQRG